MAKIYGVIKEIHTVEKGWIPSNEYFTGDFYKNKSNLTATQYSVEYVNDNGETGTEDFSLERYKEMMKTTKGYFPSVRLFGQGKGEKLVAKHIIDCGAWNGTSKDVKRYIEQNFSKYLSMGYKINMYR